MKSSRRTINNPGNVSPGQLSEHSNPGGAPQFTETNATANAPPQQFRRYSPRSRSVSNGEGGNNSGARKQQQQYMGTAAQGNTARSNMREESSENRRGTSVSRRDSGIGAERGGSPLRRKDGSNERRRRYMEDYSPEGGSRSPGNREERKRGSVSDEKTEKKIFDFKLFLVDEFVQQGVIDEQYIEKLCQQFNCQTIFFDDNMQIPDIPGRTLVLKADEIQNKHEALTYVLKTLLDIQTDLVKRKVRLQQIPNSTSSIDVMILIPEGLVALVIGGRGRQIKSYMDDSGAEIVVNQRVVGMNQRSVSIKGTPKHVALACMKIYNSLERFSSSVDDVEKVAEPISKDKVKAQAKFVVKDDSVSFIIGRRGAFTNFLKDEMRVHMQCYSDKNNRALKYDENIVKLTGSLQDISDAIVELIKRLEEYYEQLKKNFKKYPLALLIPANLVTKIIGAGGCMIKEISQKSGGANIRIHSSKDIDKDLQEIVVTIEGSFNQKKDAVCLITEQIELFKNGGPILATGQALNSNLAGQIRNSIPFAGNETHGKREGEAGRGWNDENLQAPPRKRTIKMREDEEDFDNKNPSPRRDRHHSSRSPRGDDRVHRKSRSRDRDHHHHHREHRPDKEVIHRDRDNRDFQNSSSNNQHKSNRFSVEKLQVNQAPSTSTSNNNNKPQPQLHSGTDVAKASIEPPTKRLNANNDEYEMEIENDSFLDHIGPNNVNHPNNINNNQQSNPPARMSSVKSGQNAARTQEVENIESVFVQAPATTKPFYSNFKRLADKNLRGEIDVKITIQIPPEHPVLSQIQDLIHKSGCTLNNFSNPGDENATITYKGDPKNLSLATRNISEAIIRLEQQCPRVGSGGASSTSHQNNYFHTSREEIENPAAVNNNNVF